MNMKSNHEPDVNPGGVLNEAKQLCLDTCREVLARVEQARQTMLAEFGPALRSREHLLRLALNEAEALAWQTEYPHLLFPTLAVEKVQSITAWHAQQQALQRQPSLLRLAA